MKKKVCLVLPCNIYAAPYYYRYEKVLNELGIPFDLILWNRDLIKEESSGKIYSFDLNDVANSGEKKKIFKYLQFSSFVRKHLKGQHYDKIIFLSTSAGTVSILSLYLGLYYKNSYWIDIRDYSFEWLIPYKLALSIAIKNSYMTSISSDGFKKFLPKYPYLVTHNIDFNSIEKCLREKKEKSNELPIRISFIGNVRYFEQNTKLLKIFKNDNRFRLQYYGKQSEVLKEYCQKNNIRNVDFHGRFDPEMTAEFYAKTDIINNAYGNSSMELTTALSNKLYFAASLQMPIIVSPNTYMQDITTKYNFGYTVDLNDPYTNDKLFDWYKENQNNKSSYDDFMKKVLKEYEEFEVNLREFITV